MEREKIKNEAKQIVKEKIWTYWKAGIFLIAFNILLTFIVQYYEQTNEAASIGINFLGTLAIVPLTFGVSAYCMKLARGQETDYREIFNYYKGNKLPFSMALSLVMSILITLWSLLLIIPGVIAALAYSMANYIYIEKETDPFESIKNSKQLMDGYKSDYFLFIFSFIGWFLLGIITLGIAFIYVIPYFSIASVKYYDELKIKQKKVSNIVK